jgi:phenylalanyl-tRNA synthetase beta chain
MLETGLESITYNLNRRNNDLKFFDFGKTYSITGRDKYYETDHLCLYVTGNIQQDSWRNKIGKADIYFLKGVVKAILNMLGVKVDTVEIFTHKKLSSALQMRINGSVMVQLGEVQNSVLKMFDIKQPVFFADVNWNDIIVEAKRNEIKIEEIPRFPVVYRDLAMLLPVETKYEEVEKAIQRLKLKYLENVKLFDVFESDKLGEGKRSMAINLTFLNREKTLTDKEIDEMMSTIVMTLEKDLSAEIRK